MANNRLHIDYSEDDEIWDDPYLMQCLKEPPRPLVCREHLQPCFCADGIWHCKIEPARSRCREPVMIPSPNNTPRLLISIELVSHTTYSLQSFPLHQSLAEALRSREYPTYQMSFDVFEIPLDHYEEVVHCLLPSVTKGFQLLIDTMPKQLMDKLKHENEVHDAQPNPEVVTTDIWNKLLPFQRESVQFAINHKGRILLGDDMGLGELSTHCSAKSNLTNLLLIGKTVQCLALLRYYREDWPVMIICPSSLCSQWKSQAR